LSISLFLSGGKNPAPNTFFLPPLEPSPSGLICTITLRHTGLNATDFASIARKDAMNQTAFKGWPLYHYSKDMKSGDVKGQAFKGIWFVVNPMKFPPK